jgi:protein SCO1/2
MRRLLLRYPFSTALIILTVVFSTGLLLASRSGVVTWTEPAGKESAPFEVLSVPAGWKPYPAPDFSLINQDGRPISLLALRGKVVFVNFIYTRCLDVCPIVTRQLKELQEKLGTRMERDVLFVSISVDPKHDTPKVLKQFGERHEADFRSWLMLSGSKEEIDKIRRGFDLSAERTDNPSDALNIQHTTAVYVVDRNGMIAEKISLPILALSGLAIAQRLFETRG